MKVVKNINNNVSLCLDSKGREVVVFGKGIGFTKPPYEIPLEKVQRTFYDLNSNYLTVIAQIPEEIIALSSDIVDYANRSLNYQYSNNIVFTLADHIQFAIKRKKENMHIKLPLLYEVRQLYPTEMEIGTYAVKMIEKRLRVKLPDEEAASITLHLIDYRTKSISASSGEKNLIEKSTKLIESHFHISIDRNGFNYSRFVTHMHYLMDRANKDESISSENEKLFLTLKKEYPESYQCALEINQLMDVLLSNEELLYLILHINRLCIREDCYQ